jgi:polar amino acid transport system substrate-binding protein
MVGFNRRFSRHATSVREVFRSRRTPMVISYRVSAGVVPKDVWVQDPEVGGGRIVGEVCHFVDLCEYLTSSVPVRVYADCIASADAEITPEDSVVITIHYADGSLATIQYLAHGAVEVSKERIEVFADGATALVDNFAKTIFHGAGHGAVKGRQEKGFEAELSAFLDAIRDGQESPIPFESLVRTTRVTFAALESLRLGKPIELGADER